MIFWCLLGCAAAQAAKVQSMQVSEHDGEYRIHMLAHLNVSAGAAFAVLTDYSRLARINPAIRKVKVWAASDGGVRLETRIHVCVLFYCRVLHQVQIMKVTGQDRLRAHVLPAHSDFRSGSATWRFTPDGQGSLLDFNARLRPKFWVPPLIGPWLIKNRLENQAVKTARGMERAVHADQARAN